MYLNHNYLYLIQKFMVTLNYYNKFILMLFNYNLFMIITKKFNFAIKIIHYYLFTNHYFFK